MQAKELWEMTQKGYVNRQAEKGREKGVWRLFNNYKSIIHKYNISIITSKDSN